MRYKLVLFLALSVILFSSMISAEIMLSQPSAVYNLGDTLQVEATIKLTQETNSFFEMNIVCSNSTKDFYKSPLSLKSGEEKKISSQLTLTKSFLDEMKDECYISAKFLNELKETQKFRISDKISVSLSVQNMSIEAGQKIEVKGTALKENNKQVDGFLELSVEGTDISITRAVNNGSFSADFNFPENIRAGNYILNAEVYEKAGEETTNTGEADIVLEVRKIAKRIEIAISEQNANPGESVIFKPVIYDQGNDEVPGDVSIKVYDTYDKIIFQKILKSGEEKDLQLETNSSPGYWKISAESLGLSAERLFFVNDLEKASFDIINDTLIIKNIGNVVYRKAVQISINDITEVKNLDLDIGESKSFRLSAPEGKYEVIVTDGTEEQVFNEVPLTGNIIGIEDIRGGMGFINKYPIVWIFLVVILAVFVFMLVQRVVKKKFYSYPVAEKEKEENKQDERKKDVALSSIGIPEKAEHTLVLQGRKENAGIISVKIKDLANIKKSSALTIDNILKVIVENKGAVYDTGDFIIGVFSSPTTRTFANDMIAVRVARKIDVILKEHNRKFRQKIDFGIALNSGEIIVNKEQGKLKFTGLGNTLNLAKRISDLSKQEVLLSEDMQKRVIAEVKAEREIKNGINVYHIKSISERDRHRDFIQGFLNRQKK